MSGLIKSIKKKIKKTFKFVSKVWKKIKKSKILKAIVIAAAIYFTAGAVAGFMGTGGLSGALGGIVESAGALSGGFGSIGANLATNAGTILGSVGGSLGAGGMGPPTSGSGLLGGLKTMATGIGGALKGLTTAQAMLLQSGSQLIGENLKTRSEQEKSDRDLKDLRENAARPLNIRERLAPSVKGTLAGQQGPGATADLDSIGSIRARLGVQPRKYYNPETDKFEEVST